MSQVWPLNTSRKLFQAAKAECGLEKRREHCGAGVQRGHIEMSYEFQRLRSFNANLRLGNLLLISCLKAVSGI
jgi:hypothetical protein